MANLVIFVLFSMLIIAIALEAYCRIQISLFSKPNNGVNLTIHYLTFASFVGLILLYIYTLNKLIELSGIETSLLYSSCLILVVFPMLYILVYRYPNLASKTEKWRKNT